MILNKTYISLYINSISYLLKLIRTASTQSYD